MTHRSGRPALLALLLATVSWVAASLPTAERQPPAAQAATVIRSQAQLDGYLRRHVASGEPTPLDALSAGARERFLSDLAWGSKGLGAFNGSDLAEELDDGQIRAVLGLFGSDVTVYAPRSRAAAIGIDLTGLAGISDLDRRYTRFHREANGVGGNLGDAGRSGIVAARFDALFPEARDRTSLSALSDHDLRLLWRAASQAAAGASGPDAADTALTVFEACERRGIVDALDVRTMRDILLADRRFDAADRFGDAHPEAGLAALPDFVDTLARDFSGPTVWRMSANGATLTRVAIDLAPTQVLVTAGCHFSQDAARDIAADPVLGPAFARHARWLVLPPGREDLQAVRDWNRRFPQAPAEMIHDRGAWRLLREWPMPRFHIVRGGEVVETVTGWPAGGAHRQALVDALRRAGLLDNPAPAHKAE